MKKLMFILTITVIGFVLTGKASANTIVTDDLVSYWSFDRTTITNNIVEDIWGDNDATIVGNPIITDGHIKQGLELDGDGDYVKIPNVGNFGSKIGAYTFEAWFNTTYKEKKSAIYKVEEGFCRGDKNGIGLVLNAWLDRIEDTVVSREDTIMINRSVIKNRNDGCLSSVTAIDGPVSDGEWHHIVYTTREPTKEEFKEHNKAPQQGCLKSRLYIDKKSIYASLSCTMPLKSLPFLDPIYLGAVNKMGEASGFFKGVFDEVRIYDRALTPEEIARNYDSRIGYSVEPVQKLPTVWGALKRSR